MKVSPISHSCLPFNLLNLSLLHTLSHNRLTSLIQRSSKQAVAKKLSVFFVGFILFLFPVNSSQAKLLETFEGNYVPSSTYGSIPAGWQAEGSTLVKYSKSSDHYEGHYSLGATVSYDSQYYAVLSRTFSGLNPGDVVTVSAKVKCSTPYEAEGGLMISIGSTYRTATNYWYSNSPEDEWRTAELEDIEVPSSGELLIYLKMHSRYSSSTFNWDSVTIQAAIGSLQVSISPKGANDAGAQWRRVGTNKWLSSGTKEMEVPVGSYTVEFKNVSGWTKPKNRSVKIVKGQTTSVSGTYYYTAAKPGLLWKNVLTGKVILWLMNTDGTVASVEPIFTSVNSTIAGTGDFNGDGICDMIKRDAGTGRTSIYFMNADGSRKSSKVLFTSVNSTIAGTGDFNRDGICDLIKRDTDTGRTSIYFMNADGSLKSSKVLFTSVNSTIAGTGDFNRDGICDLIKRDTDTGRTSLYFMNIDGSRKSYKVLLTDLNTNLVP